MTQAEYNLEDIAIRRAARRIEHFAKLDEIFHEAGSTPPQIIWSPSVSDLSNPLIRSFDARRGALPTKNGMIEATSFDLEAFRGLSEWISLIDVGKNGTEFRYARLGEGVAQISGMPMEGATSDDVGGHVGVFFRMVFRAALRYREPVFTQHEAPADVFASHWDRLIIPLVDPMGAIVRFVVMCVPDNELRPGLEIMPDPVLIVTEQLAVSYANRAARETFGQSPILGQEMGFFDLTGIELRLEADPATMSKQGGVRDLMVLSARDTMLQQYLLTVRGIHQWGNPFYLMTLRPAIAPP